MRGVRVSLVVVGLVALAYGGWSLLALGLGNTVAVLPWLAGVVVAHDAVLAPLVLLLGAASLRVGAPALRRGAVMVLVVLGSLTLAAVPVLGRFGARPDNPTLLDRPYARGWLAVAVLVLFVVAATELVRARRERRRTPPDGS